MQFLSLTAALICVSSVTALVTRRDVTPIPLGLPNTNVTVVDGTCMQYTGQRTCAIGGDRVEVCYNYQEICPVGFNSASSTANLLTNQQECASKADGAACNAVWRCCRQ